MQTSIPNSSGNTAQRSAETSPLVATSIFLSFWDQTTYRYWHSTPTVELLHAAVNRPGGIEINYLAPRYLSYGSVPSFMGLRGDSFSQTSRRMTQPSDSLPPTLPLALLEDERLRVLCEAVTNTKLGDDVRPLLRRLYWIEGWSRDQSRVACETVPPEVGIRQPGPSIFGPGGTRAKTITTGTRLRFSIHNAGHTIRWDIVPAAALDEDRSSPNSTAMTLLPTDRSWAFHNRANSSTSSSSDEAVREGLMNTYTRTYELYKTQILKLARQMPSYGSRAEDWRLRSFTDRLRECESIIKTASIEACEAVPGWGECEVAKVSVLPFVGTI